MSGIFISYSRKDMAFARRLHAALQGHDLETWIDWQDIPPSSDWFSEIKESIEQADAVVFIISQESAVSEVCGTEIEHAYQNKKRLIPIVLDDIDPGTVPPYIAALNWIFFRERDDFSDSLENLLGAVSTDLDWVKEHTRIQNRALEWDRNRQSGAFLLRGKELQEAEGWLTHSDGKDPLPSELQQAYIVASRRATTRRQGFLIGVLLTVLTIAIGLSVFAIFQREVAVTQRDMQSTAEAEAVQEAEMRATAVVVAVSERDARATAQAETQVQRDIALSQYLAGESKRLTNEQFDLRLLLSLAAVDFHPGVEAKGSLLDTLLDEPLIRAVLMNDPAFKISSLAVNPEGTQIAVGSQDGSIRVLDAENGRIIHELEQSAGDDRVITGLSFSGNGGWLVADDSLDETVIWDLGSTPPQPKTLSGFVEWDSFLAINSDGSEVAALTTRGDAAFFDAENGQVLGRLEKSSTDLGPMVFSPDGKWIAAFEAGSKLYLWERETGERFHQYINLGEPDTEQVPHLPLNNPMTLAFQPDSKAISFGNGRKTYFWDISGESISSSDASVGVGYNQEGEAMAFSFRRMNPFEWAFVSDDVPDEPFGYGFHWDLAGGEHLGYFWNPLTHQYFLVWETPPGGTLLVRISDRYSDLYKYIVDSVDLESIVHVPGSDGNLMVAAGCGKLLDEGGCSQGMIQFWGGETWDLIGDPIPAHKDWIPSVDIHPDGAIFATASEDNSLQFWETESKKPLDDPIEFDYLGPDTRLAFSPSGDLIALYDGWSRIYFLDTASREVLGEPFEGVFNGEAETLRDFAFSPDGRQIAVIHLGDLFEHKVKTEEIRDVYLDYIPSAINPDGELVGTIHGKAILGVWNINQPMSPKPVSKTVLKEISTEDFKTKEFVSQKDFYPLAYHPDGSTLAVGIEGVAMLVSVSTGEIFYKPPRSMISISITGHLAYSQDGDILAAANTHGTVQLLDGVRGVPIGNEFFGSGLAQDDLVFTPEGDRLFVVYHGYPIDAWEMELAFWQRLACGKLNREFSAVEWQSYLGQVDTRVVCQGLE